MDEYYRSSYYKHIAQLNLPYIPTPKTTIELFFSYLADHHYLSSNLHLIDLGAGDGRVILYAAENYGIHATGIEINHDFVEEIKNEINKRHLDSNCNIFEGDLYEQNLSQYNIIFLFILPYSFRFLTHLIDTIKENAIVVNVRYPLDYFIDKLQPITIIKSVENYDIHIYKKKSIV